MFNLQLNTFKINIPRSDGGIIKFTKLESFSDCAYEHQIIILNFSSRERLNCWKSFISVIEQDERLEKKKGKRELLKLIQLWCRISSLRGKMEAAGCFRIIREVIQWITMLWRKCRKYYRKNGFICFCCFVNLSLRIGFLICNNCLQDIFELTTQSFTPPTSKALSHSEIANFMDIFLYIFKSKNFISWVASNWSFTFLYNKFWRQKSMKTAKRERILVIKTLLSRFNKESCTFYVSVMCLIQNWSLLNPTSLKLQG